MLKCLRRRADIVGKGSRLLTILSTGNQYLPALNPRRDMHVWKPLVDGTVTEYGDMESMALKLVHGVYGRRQMSVAQSLHTT